MKRAIGLMILLPLGLLAQEVSLTVYNQNRALVREVRSLEIAKGRTAIAFTDVAAQIDPTSVHFKSLTSPDKLAILEQNFEYDLVGAQKILEKYLDQPIRLVLEGGEVFEGVLLGSSGDVILRQDDGRVRIVRQQQIQHFDFPALPEGLITQPTLVWQVQNDGQPKQKTELSYLTSGIGWHAEYVAVVDKDDKALDLSGWVSIDNQSGATYTNAKLKLVAGDVNLINRNQRMAAEAMPMAKAASGFEEKSFFEYHLYTLDRPATVKDRQTKQISLFPAASTPVTKRYIWDARREHDKVKVILEFENRESHGLGMALPRGTIRIYKADDDGALTFIGEDMIDHTPRDEKVEITAGNAFDLVGQSRIVNRNRISERASEETYEIVLRNHKDEAVIIRAFEHLRNEDWKLTKATLKETWKDAMTFFFDVPIPARQEATVQYTILKER